MTEKQNIEYKISWRNEYLKWICGFANAQGGKPVEAADKSGENVGETTGEKENDGKVAVKWRESGGKNFKPGKS